MPAAKSKTPNQVLPGGYVLERIIDKGCFAVVWEGRTETNRRVAIKILHPQFARDEAFLSRFRREAQNAAGLNHPNIH